MPIIRLAEVYYMLAECDFRLGNKEKAVELFNTVRKRNFANAADPNPVASANIDKYRILDEWSIEFLGEGRRRTDLIRWKAFTTEKWWDHNPSTSAHLNRFPVSDCYCRQKQSDTESGLLKLTIKKASLRLHMHVGFFMIDLLV